jgi:hypothetical protein
VRRAPAAISGLWRWLLRLTESRHAAIVLFLLALAVYGLVSLALPVGPGRDLGTYLRVYDQLFDSVVYPQAMAARTPGAALVAGPLLDTGSAVVVEVAMALLYALSILSWCAVARRFGAAAAILTAAGLLAYPGYAILFHALSTDALFAAGFAFTAPLVVRLLERPSAGRAAAVGGAVAGLVLVRPSNQVLVLLVVLPLLAGGTWRRRLLGAAAFLAAAALPLLGWAAHNAIRADDFTVARGGGVAVPFFRAFVEDRIVRPENGPASRELARAIERELLTREPYRSYGIDLDEFFSAGSARMHEDMIGLSDRVWGWDDDYAHVASAAREAVRKHPGTYARGVARDVYRLLWWPLLAGAPPARAGDGSAPGGGAADTVVVDGRTLPRPSEGEPIPAARQSGFVSTPDGRIREVWTSPTEHHIEFRDPSDARRAAALDRHLIEQFATFPERTGVRGLRSLLDDLSRLYPRPLMWLLAALIAAAVRRPRDLRGPLALAAAALVVIGTTALAVYAVAEYTVPVAPAFVLLFAVALLGPRRERAAGRVSQGSIVASE